MAHAKHKSYSLTLRTSEFVQAFALDAELRSLARGEHWFVALSSE